jgi:uncharacterized protein (TIGR02145 family)
MRKSFSFLIACCLFTFHVAIAQIPSYVPTNGLVGWWPFNGNANDESGNGNNGIVNGATLTSDRSNLSNSSYLFGIGKNIDLGQVSNLGNNPTNATYSFWINLSSLPTDNIERYPVISRRHADMYGYCWCTPNVYKSNKMVFIKECDGNAGTDCESSILYVGSWYHFVCMKKQDSLYVFQNGQLINSAFDNHSISGSPQNLIVGWQGAWNWFFDGKIDDIAIYNRALTQEEVTSLYQGSSTNSSNNGSVGINTTTPHPSAALDITDTQRGLLIPRMTAQQRIAIQNPATGLMVYQTDSSSGFWYHNGQAWTNINTQGTQGPRGEQGIQGVQGEPGTQGLQGIKGDSGISIRNTEVVGDSLYITLSTSHRLNAGHVRGASGFLTNGTTAGNTPYWDGSNWVTNNSNIYNNGGNVGIKTNVPDPSAALEVKSNNSGFLPPRMTYAERNAIQNPARGLMIFCTDCDSSGQPQFYNGSRWCNMLGSSANVPISQFVNLPSVTIGTQIWSTKNLDVARYRNGDIIPQVTDPTQWSNLTTGAWCWYNNDSVNYAATYGRLYNWYAVNDPRGLAPEGWNIPNDNNWNTLKNYLDPSSINSDYSLLAGGFLKETGTLNWLSPNEGAVNSSGFSARPGGLRVETGNFQFLNSYGLWWSSTQLDNLNAFSRSVGYFNTGFGKNSTYGDSKKFGLSVRVIRDTIINAALPSTTTTAVTNISSTSASGGGDISSDGGAAITSRGVCWSTSPNPTVALSTKTTDGMGAGIFTSSITGLTPGTTYYVRAYAINSVGSSYGAQQTFTTTTNVANLPSVTIGSQIWSTKNLDVARYRNGDPIPQVTDPTQWANLTTGAWCWFANDSIRYAAMYGRLYNWHAVSDPRGLAPFGWHIPTISEWNILTKYIDPTADTTQCCSNNLASAIKNTSGWESTGGYNGNNSSGFSGLPGGFRSPTNGSFWSAYWDGLFWSCSVHNSTNAWGFYLGSTVYSLNKESVNKNTGYSVRLVRD